MMFVVSDRELRNEAADRIEDRIKGIAVSAQDHPCGKCSCSFASEGIETLIDDHPGIRFSGTGTFDRIGDTAIDRIGDRFRKRALKPGGRTEMVEQIGVGTSDFGSDRF